MTDTNSQSTEVAVRAERPAREIRVVESVSPIMDTARFEHLGRVATVMAHAGLMPMSLTHVKVQGTKDQYEPLDFEVVRARAFLIANQADLWKADPNAVAQCASLVHGKLMFEGKLVHGLIETRLGIKLRYQFGTYVAATRSVDLSKMPGPDDQSLGVLVSGRFTEEDFDREIVGCVGMWHKGASSPWGAATAWPRQLRYMGAREWARAHSPGLLLGIMTDDEIDAARDDRREVSYSAAPAVPAMISTGFSAPAQTEALAGTEVETRPHEAESAGEVEAEPEPDAIKATETLEVKTAEEVIGTAVEAEVEQLTKPEATAQEAAKDEPVPETPEEAAPALDEAQEVKADPAATEPSPPEPETPAAEVLEPEQLDEGYPEPGEVYHLDGNTWGSAGRREAYKDGKPFSTALRSTGFKIYADHLPEGPGGAIMAGAIDPAEEDIGDAPGGPADAFDAYTMGLRNVGSWEQGQAALNALAQTEAWKQAMSGKEPHRVRQARMSLWLRGEELKANGKPWIDVLDSLTAFRCWIEATEDSDAIMGNFQALVPTPLYTSLNEDRRKSFETSVKNRMRDIQEGRA